MLQARRPMFFCRASITLSGSPSNPPWARDPQQVRYIHDADWRPKCFSSREGIETLLEGGSVAKERNNIYAIAADAVDLALDTAGTIGSMVGGIANAVGIGSDEHERKEADDAAERVAKSLRQEAQAAKPRAHKASAGNRHMSKTRLTKSVKKVKRAAKPRAARKAS
jgi:hypothetical protein